jgi:hypothetical protein
VAKNNLTILDLPQHHRLCVDHGSSRLYDRLTSGPKGLAENSIACQEVNGQKSKFVAVEKRSAGLMMKLWCEKAVMIDNYSYWCAGTWLEGLFCGYGRTRFKNEDSFRIEKIIN